MKSKLIIKIEDTFKVKFNDLITDEIAKLYHMGTNIAIMCRKSGEIEEIIEPEIQVLIDKWNKLRI